MIPIELFGKWEEQQERAEVLFLADHGGGCPDCLIKHVNTPEDRLRVLRQMGFRVAERYDMPNSESECVSDPGEVKFDPWVRLTNGIAINLADGFVVRSSSERGRRK